MTSSVTAAITLLAIAVLIEGWFILRLNLDLVRLKAELDQKAAALAEAVETARKLAQACRRAIGRMKQSLQGDLK